MNTPLEMALTGTGIAAQDGQHLVLAPENEGLSFGSSAAGDTTIQTITVSNASTATADLSLWLDLSDQVNYAVEVDGVEIGYGSLIYGGSPGAPLLTLAPGESKQVEVLYKPETPGEHVSSVHIRHDDVDYRREEVLVPVWGVGLDGERKRYYYLSDHLGSVRATVNETGEVVHYEDYYPFGLSMPTRRMDNGNKAARERYTGHELDEETDLYYAGARYYDPVIGRWLAVDPLADKFPAHSPYNYVLNNPIHLLDPDGQAPASCCVPKALLRDALRDPRNPLSNPSLPALSKTEQAVDEFVTGLIPVAGDVQDISNGEAGLLTMLGPVGDAIKFGKRLLGFADEAAGISRAGTRSAEEVFEESTQEAIANYTVIGTKGLSGDTFVREIFSFAVEEGKQHEGSLISCGMAIPRGLPRYREHLC